MLKGDGPCEPWILEDAKAWSIIVLLTNCVNHASETYLTDSYLQFLSQSSVLGSRDCVVSWRFPSWASWECSDGEAEGNDVGRILWSAETTGGKSPTSHQQHHVMETSGDEIADVVLKQFDSWEKKRKPVVRTNGVREWVPLSGIVAQGRPLIVLVQILY